jgi:hypothetical protein
MNYINGQTKTTIICPQHGPFEQRPNSHLLGWECKQCGNEKCSETKRDDTAEFIRKARETHGEKFDYSKVNYQGNKTKVTIICTYHGEFNQLPAEHIIGKGCHKCSGLVRSNTEEFIAKARNKHGDKYDYSKTHYNRKGEKVIITCKKHGDFQQETSSHLSGCPNCKNSLGEETIYVYLKRLNVNFIREYKYADCKDIEELPFDFYLPDHNLLIEYDGKQHFEPLEFFGGMEAFLDRVKKDTIKINYAKNKEIPLLRIRFDESIDEKLDEFLIEYL